MFLKLVVVVLAGNYIDNQIGGHCSTAGIVVYSYSTGNSLGSIHLVWEVAGDTAPDAITQGNAECIRIIQPSLPFYHTRAMKKDFINTAENFKCGKPAVLKRIYKRLTGCTMYDNIFQTITFLTKSIS